jgi:hypothetical protein
MIFVAVYLASGWLGAGAEQSVDSIDLKPFSGDADLDCSATKE